jgi:hypothetical protein
MALLGMEEPELEVFEGDPSLRSSLRVIAIGSLYSDFAATLRTLRLASLIDSKGQWIGRRTVLVFTGVRLLAE